MLPASKESQHEHCLTCWLSLNPNATGTNSVTGSLNDLIHLVHWIDSAPRLNRDYLLDFIRVRENSFSTVPTHRDPPEMVNYKDTKNNCHVLITGSLYLVGNALKVSRFFELLCVWQQFPKAILRIVVYAPSQRISRHTGSASAERMVKPSEILRLQIHSLPSPQCRRFWRFMFIHPWNIGCLLSNWIADTVQYYGLLTFRIALFSCSRKTIFYKL